MVKNAVYITFFLFVITGAYYTGYSIGSAHTKVKYVTKEVEVVKYVSQERAEIQSRPNASRTELISLLNNGKL